MLYTAKATDRLGRVADGTTVLDFDAEEKKRKATVSTAVAAIEWNGAKINIIDTPGLFDFAGGMSEGIRAADSVLIVTAAGSGFDVGAEKALKAANARGISRMFAITRCDADNTDFYKTFAAIKDAVGGAICPVIVPYMDGGKVAAYVNLASRKAFDYSGGEKKEVAMPSDPQLDEMLDILTEAVASSDDELMEKFFAGETFTREEIIKALNSGVSDGSVIPVYACAGYTCEAIDMLLDEIVYSAPSAADKAGENGLPCDENGPLAAICFKTIADPFVGKMSFFKVMAGTIDRDMSLRNLRTGVSEKMSHMYIMKGKEQTEVDELACGDLGMIAKLSNTNTGDTLRASGDVAYARVTYPTPYMCRAIVPETAKDESKISQAIAKMLEEDLTLRYENNPETKQMLIYGMGDMHLSVLAAKLKTRFGVSVRLEEPKIPYREKITKPCDVEGKHKKQNGGSGQYGHVKIRFAPGEEEGLTFVDATVGGSVPKNFIPAVEKGLQDAMAKGAVGFPLVRLRAELYDGSYHAVDSDELSFRTAANLAYRKCLELGAPVLLEPVGELFVTVPEALVGDIMGDLNKRRASVLGMHPHESKTGFTTVEASAPKSELADYPIALRAMTQGRGWFDYTVTGYDTVPANVAAKVIAALQTK